MNQNTDTTLGGAQYLLAADIGGTNARFVAVPTAVSAGEAKSEEVKHLSLATADFQDTAALIDEVLVRFGSDLKFAGCCLAIAGPVADGRGTLTNGRLRFDDLKLSDKLSCPAVVVNDFFAVAASISDEMPLQVVGEQTVGRKSAIQTRVRAVLGPGTGLGMGFLTLTPQSPTDRWQVFPSEGGNADFAPVDALELELLGIVQRTQSTVSIETLVSGRGLPILYRALCELWGAAPEHTTAATISDAGVALADPVSHKTLELFCAMLGTAAGNFALTVGARDGVYLAGGILPRIREFFCASEFRRRFDDRGPLSAFNQQIPTYLVLDPEPGLTGAIREARNLVEGI